MGQKSWISQLLQWRKIRAFCIKAHYDVICGTPPFSHSNGEKGEVSSFVIGICLKVGGEAVESIPSVRIVNLH